MSQTTYAASLPLLKTDWQMSASQAGLISSAFYFGFLISLFVVGFMADRIGAKRTYLGTSLLAAVSALVFAAFARDFLSAFILYGLTGLFAGGSYTPGLAILAQRFPSRGRGRAIGFYIAASSAGYAGSLLLSSAVLSVSGWQAAFFATCLGPTLGMVVGVWILRGTPNVTPPPVSPERTEGNLLQAVVGNKPALLIILAYTFHSWEVLGLWAWTPFYLSVVFAGESGAAVAASAGAGFTALAYLVAVGGPIVGGSLSDRLGRTTVILLMSITSVACSFSIGWLLTAPFWLVVALSFVYQFTAIGDSPVLSTGLSELVPPHYLGSAYSLRSVLGFGAGSISPWVYGLVLDWGRGGPEAAPLLAFGLAFSAFGMVGVLCPLFTYWLRRLPDSARMAGGLR
ncbi:MAG: MFS transporter [SAR324 cluster bacterium]|nr:MFS transporter [SAR324 cluster bacterium]